MDATSLHIQTSKANKAETKTVNNYDMDNQKGNPIFGLLVSLKRESNMTFQI